MTFDGPIAAVGSLTVTGSDARSTAGSLGDGLALQTLCDLALEVLNEEGVAGGQLDLHLVDDDAMAQLNEEQMGYSGPTDVLSFPLDDPSDSGQEPVLLGDVVLCPKVAMAQAVEHVGSANGELQLLVIHGVLHVLGHDHVEVEETQRMRNRERFHLARLGVTHPEPV